MKQAIGMIETKGMVGLIEAADAMLKSSNVHLLGSSQVGGGINTVMIEGDVAAVETAIQSAKASVALLGDTILLSGHVIPRPEITPETFVTCKKKRSTQEEDTTHSEQSTVNQMSKIEVEMKEESKEFEETVEVIERRIHPVEPKEKQEKESSGSLIVSEKVLKAEKEDLKEAVNSSLKQAETPAEKTEGQSLQEKLQKMTVAELRKLAKEQKEFSHPKKEIYQMSKAKLIQALIDSLIINE